MRRVAYMVGTRDFATLRAEQFMQDQVMYHHVDDTADKVASTMTEGGFGSVPILARDGTVIGLVSEFDLLKAIMEGKELAKVAATEVMTPLPVTVTRDTPALEIIRLLQEKHFIRVPVVDDEGKLVGVVARRDILLGYMNATKPVWTF